MNGILSNLLYVLLITAATGSAALVAWYCLGDILMRSGYVRLYDAGIRLVVCLFLLPIVYMALGWMDQSGLQWSGKLFERTPAITEVYQILCAVWVLGAVAVGAWYLHRTVLVDRLTRDPKKYFACLLHVEEICGKNHAQASLKAVNGKSDLLERIEFMDKLMKIKKKPMHVAVMIVCAMLFGTSVTVAAASGGAASLYVKLYEMTDVAEKVEKQAMPELTEYEDQGPAPDVTVEEGQVEGIARAIKGFSWSIRGNAMKTTSSFFVNEGQQISINVYQNNHTDKNIRVGIIKPSGYRLYVYSSGQITHNFTITEFGYYKVFVENTTSVTIDVDGTYNVY